MTIGAVKGQSQEIYVSEHVKNARVVALPVTPAPDAIARMLLEGRVQAFAANRQRLEDIVRAFPGLRILGDDFMVNGQALIVAKGDVARLKALDQFIADVLASGFVKASLDRNGAAGVEVAPVPATPEP